MACRVEEGGVQTRAGEWEGEFGGACLQITLADDCMKRYHVRHEQ